MPDAEARWTTDGRRRRRPSSKRASDDWTMSTNCWWTTVTLGQPHRRPAGVVPGFRRASACTNRRARSTASVAMPSHTELHRRWAIGSMVRVEMSA